MILVGGVEAAERAREYGIESDDRLPGLLGHAPLSWRALRRALDRIGRRDVLVCWSLGTAILGTFAARGEAVVPVLSLPPPVFEGMVKWAPAARCLRRAALVAYPTSFLRDAWVARFTLLGCPSIVLPDVGASEGGPSPGRDELRRQWGLEDDDVAILAVGEPEEVIDAHAAVFAAGVLGVAGKRAVAVVPSRAGRLDRALRFARSIRPPRRVIVEDAPPTALLDACDVALWYEPEAEGHRSGASSHATPLGVVSLAFASRRGLRVVAHDHGATRGVVGDRCAQLVDTRDRLHLTRALLRSIDSPRAAPCGEPSRWVDVFESELLQMLRRQARDASRRG